MRHLPRGRLHIVSAKPEADKALKRVKAEQGRTTRVADKKKITDRQLDRLIEMGKLVRASDLGDLKVEANLPVQEEAPLFPQAEDLPADILSAKEIQDLLEAHK